MMILPPYLQPGDTIGITCPAGAVTRSDMQAMFEQLKNWGYTLEIGKTVGSNFGKFSATDDERLSELQYMLDHPSINAILFGRGGYGVVRIIDRLDFTKFKNTPKWLLGYSDITCLHSHVQTQFGIASIHAHMGSAYKPENQNLFSTNQIQEVLRGQRTQYQIAAHSMNRVGESRGILTGGNLALLSDLIGTPSDIETDGKILVIEDVSEYKYNIDRMLWQLLRAGKLNHLAGLIVGSFTETLDNDIPFGMSEYEIVWEKVKAYNYPVCFNFPVGHQALNYPLKLGATFDFKVSEQGVQLNEIVEV